jgi:hypothetical protein
MNGIIKIEKGQIVNVPAEYQEEEGCVAFQLIELTYTFFGKTMSQVFDTKIQKNGKQIVFNGNGFIKDGFEIN